MMNDAEILDRLMDKIRPGKETIEKGKRAYEILDRLSLEEREIVDEYISDINDELLQAYKIGFQDGQK